MELRVTNPKTGIITEGRDFRQNLIAPTMTYFENALGGKVCVMSLTVRDNPSQALYNYRRQALLQRMICKMSDEYPLVQNAPDIYAIALKPKEDSDLLGALTLINLSEDDANRAEIHLPAHLREAKHIFTVAKDGSLSPLAAEPTADGLRLCEPLFGCTPTYIVFKK